ncbi:magnesium transporter MRS2 homolog, mitochondrial [Onychostruthus taczanowskii]|uniref:magnesium transporter MRS2 homolog, mitochondrial n=1 Tax=Onychostruthus taczanowskii TaxID=356909 RepID=UPI001B80121D|nr:magnesium transporter MRS2 homolog, mitochondrial [Onychostruthus taczanowskii]
MTGIPASLLSLGNFTPRVLGLPTGQPGGSLPGACPARSYRGKEGEGRHSQRRAAGAEGTGSERGRQENPRCYFSCPAAACSHKERAGGGAALAAAAGERRGGAAPTPHSGTPWGQEAPRSRQAAPGLPSPRRAAPPPSPRPGLLLLRHPVPGSSLAAADAPGAVPGRGAERGRCCAGLHCSPAPWAAAAAAARGLRWAGRFYQHAPTETSQATLASVSPVFAVMKFDKEGNTTYFEKKKTELYQELGLQARDLRFQHVMSIATRNNRIIMRMEFLKAVITPEFLLILDYRNLSLEHWLLNELASQLAGEGQLVTYSLPFEFRAIEAILQYWISKLQGRLNTLQPQILETLEALVDPKLLSVDRSKLHILLQNGKSLSELETDLKVFKETILEILDEEEVIEELCLSKWTDPQVFEESTSGIDHAEEMELLLENYYRQAEDLLNEARELRVLIDDSESIIFINLDSHRNVMMRLNLQLTMGTFSVSLFGLIGVAFGMNLESSLEEDPRIFWLVTGIMFLGSGLIWRRLLSFLGRHLDPPLPPHVPAALKKSQPAAGRVDIKTSLKGETFGLSRSTLTNQ